MALPVVARAVIFNGITASETKSISDALEVSYVARSILLDVVGGSWLLEIQGRTSNTATWLPIAYARTNLPGDGPLSIDPLLVDFASVRQYVVPNPPPIVRLVATQQGTGALTVHGAFHSEPYVAAAQTPKPSESPQAVTNLYGDVDAHLMVNGDRVSEVNAIPITGKVEVMQTGVSTVVGKTVRVGPSMIPGIVTGAAYAAGDAFGTRGMIEVPVSGVIQTALFLDLDDEGLETEVWLFNTENWVEIADNAAFNITDQDLLRGGLVGVLDFATFFNVGSNQVSMLTPQLAYVAPQRKLYYQCVARGAPNIAADNMPRLTFTVLADE